MRKSVRRSVPNRPTISNILIKPSAKGVFRSNLLSNPTQALSEMNLSPEDAEILAGIKAPTLPEYACQMKMQLLEHCS